MLRRSVKSITVEYHDGSVETYQENEMRHVSLQRYKKGAKKQSEGYTYHEIVWTNPDPLYPLNKEE